MQDLHLLGEHQQAILDGTDALVANDDDALSVTKFVQIMQLLQPAFTDVA